MNPEVCGLWFRVAPDARACLRIICFPFAGGGASVFHSWISSVPAGVQVCAVELPGRENRYNERAPDEIATILPSLATAVTSFLDRPYALFGHSLGAFLAFELAGELRRRALPPPVHFFASACRAPHLPSRLPPVHNASDEAFLDRLGAIAAVSQEFRDNPELRNLMLPMLRADFQMAEQYTYTPEPLFEFPITALGGNQDQFVPAADLVAWHNHTSGPFRLRLLPGGHLFLKTSPGRVIQTVLDEVGANRFTANRAGSPGIGSGSH